MNTDKELLELATKAAGIAGEFDKLSGLISTDKEILELAAKAVGIVGELDELSGLISTDKELLTLAAKAAEIVVEFDELSGLYWLENQYSGIWWNPLHHDGDALRLAVKLGLVIDYSDTKPATWVYLDNYDGVDAVEQHGTDPYAATRRAIVRAAAAIGRAMT